MTYEKEIVLSNNVAQRLLKALNWEDGDNPGDRFEEDDTYTETAIFENGYQMDIKVCGTQCDCPGACNGAWSEAVLFNEKGSELCCTDPDNDLIGEWELEYEDDVYLVNVRREEKC